MDWWFIVIALSVAMLVMLIYKAFLLLLGAWAVKKIACDFFGGAKWVRK
ncbi:MAG: hypothetical protein Q7R46_00970 [bacterium]|nr:hypothetical protein [bacterium]